MCVAFFLILGALIELFGLALVAWDVRDSMKQIKGIQDDPHWEEKQPAPKRQRGALIELIATMAAGNLKRRAAGIVVFGIGLVIQTGANLAAL